MLLKWLFTLLAIIWLYQALRPLLLPRKPPPYQPPRPPSNYNANDQSLQKNRFDDEGEYIDYEEVK